MPVIKSKGQNSSRQHRSRDLTCVLNVTLEELYNGAVRKLAVQNYVVCDKCRGRGSKTYYIQKCKKCQGTCTETTVEQIDGISKTNWIRCRQCSELDDTIPIKDCCNKCRGKKTIRERFVLDVDVKRGMRDGQKIVFRGEGIHEPNKQSGNLIVTLKQKKHPVFKHSNNDLVMVMPLTKFEAERGFQKTIPMLDKRKLSLTSTLGEIVKNNDFNTVLGEGMPTYNKEWMKGQLFITYKVESD